MSPEAAMLSTRKERTSARDAIRLFRSARCKAGSWRRHFQERHPRVFALLRRKEAGSLSAGKERRLPWTPGAGVVDRRRDTFPYVSGYDLADGCGCFCCYGSLLCLFFCFPGCPSWK
ncbi:hypothetical protein MTO96_003208 [Rhipicephalus appendiculatus]